MSAERDRDAGGDAPVVADDEVPPEAAERAEVPHASAPAATSCDRRRRSARTSANETSAEEGDHAEQRELVAGPVDAGALGAPEAAEARQQQPDRELDRVLGHARERPVREHPATTTTTSAAAAPAAASPSRPCALPKAITMKATSRPSSRTPLNATVNEYQSSPARSSSPAAAPARAPRGTPPPRRAAPCSRSRAGSPCAATAARRRAAARRRRAAARRSGSSPSAGPSAATSAASTSTAAPTPISVERQPRTTPTASTIVSASTISTALARNAPGDDQDRARAHETDGLSGGTTSRGRPACSATSCETLPASRSCTPFRPAREPMTMTAASISLAEIDDPFPGRRRELGARFRIEAGPPGQFRPLLGAFHRVREVCLLQQRDV